MNTKTLQNGRGDIHLSVNVKCVFIQWIRPISQKFENFIGDFGLDFQETKKVHYRYSSCLDIKLLRYVASLIFQPVPVPAKSKKKMQY